jgi:hypothetical protein
MEVRNKYAAGMLFLLTLVTAQSTYSGATDESIEKRSQPSAAPMGLPCDKLAIVRVETQSK